MLGAWRDAVLLLALSIAAAGYDQRDRIAAHQGDTPASNVILVVSDGLRWQEVVRGADPDLIGDAPADIRRQYLRGSAAERRDALMPFVWRVIAREGQVLGNRELGSSVDVTNGKNFSYPGYNEMLVGYPDARVDRNDLGPNPNVTVFEWLNRRPELRGRVATVGAWETFADVFNSERSRLPMFAGKVAPLDARAHTAALRFLREKHPRALFVGYVETDDNAHRNRYDLTLEAAHQVDVYLAELWSAVQSDPRYRGRTTLIFTADHGRGRTPSDWSDHGPNVAGAHEVFVAMIGPRIERLGERRNMATVTQAQVAATVAAALGLNYRRDTPSAAAPIPAFVRR